MIAGIVRAIRAGKSSLLFVVAVLGLLWCAGCAPMVYEASAGGYATQDDYAAQDDYATQDDYDYLSYYGEWVQMPPYGMVWRPGVVAGWAPFYNGHWVWSNYGWAWVSYEPFGWLVYHYGYWNFNPGLGWYWCPGHRWSPARVQWYTFGDYTAWAPLPPPNVYWPDPWDTHTTNVWVVVNYNDFTREDIGRHRMMRPIPRENFQHQGMHRRAPDIHRLEDMTRTPVPRVEVRKQDVDVRRVVAKPAREYDHTSKKTLQRMVLPPAERTRMEEHMTKVEREVITPRKGTPPPTPQPVDENKKKSDSGRKSDTSRQKKKG